MENKKRYFKFIAGFFGIIVGVFILSNIVLWGWQKYEWRQQEKLAQKIQEDIRKLQEEDYQRAMADTYGGKTPQETLQMFIDAVKRGDFELAGRYFVISKQKEWENELIDIRHSNKLDEFLKPLLDSKDLQVQYSSINKKKASIYETVLISFMQYPNGIWKIIEI